MMKVDYSSSNLITCSRYQFICLISLFFHHFTAWRFFFFTLLSVPAIFSTPTITVWGKFVLLLCKFLPVPCWMLVVKICFRLKLSYIFIASDRVTECETKENKYKANTFEENLSHNIRVRIFSVAIFVLYALQFLL